ncbi:MAG TPA: glycosyltransferase family 4 protein [Candidatus Deferrimicrobium sp.]|nr:glycosyltransferase family 4 protein [Candidatus Deferrimicrobium sp.]
MKTVILLAHGITNPLKAHRRMEFSNRILFLSKYYERIILVSKDDNLKNKVTRLEIEKITGFYIYRIPLKEIIATLQFTRLVRMYKPDLVICDSTSDAPTVILPKILFNFPIAVFARAFDTDLFIYSSRVRVFRKSKLRRLIKGFLFIKDTFIFNLSEKIISVSPALIKYINYFILRAHNNKTKFIPNSYFHTKNIPQVSITEAKQKLDAILKQFNENPFIITYAGNLSPNKRPDIAISALKILLKKHLNVILLIIGTGILSQDLHNYCSKLEISHRVFFLGKLPQYETIALISKSHLLIHPSISEGFSNSISESMAMGTPVLSYAHKTIKDFCRKKGAILVNNENPKDYASEIYRILTDSSLRETSTKNSLALIKPLVEYSNEKRYTDIYQEIKAAEEHPLQKQSIRQVIRLFLRWLKLFFQYLRWEEHFENLEKLN